VTEPITLEDVYLGPFRIQLELNKDIRLSSVEALSELYQGGAYHVIALEPNLAATDASVNHPHVSNERLCEGDGYAPIRAALEQGRLCDFFTLVRSILNTYSPDSPYVRLDDGFDKLTIMRNGSKIPSLSREWDSTPLRPRSGL